MKIREYTKKDVESLREIWNQVVEDGVAFPQDEPLSPEEAEEFFAGQSYVGVAEKEEMCIRDRYYDTCNGLVSGRSHFLQKAV